MSAVTEEQLYKPLRHADSVRLFNLHPWNSNNDVITGNLTEVRLSAAPKYECVSYTWGTDSDTIPIVVSGFTVHVRKTLHACLNRARLESDARLLWIDYLCISQNDLDEKASQVQMIGQTFSAASKVIVWLGCLATSHKWDKVREESVGVNLDTHFDAIVISEYWQRTWIVQEVLLATSVEIWDCCGRIPWRSLLAYLRAEKWETDGNLSGVLSSHLHTNTKSSQAHHGGLTIDSLGDWRQRYHRDQYDAKAGDSPISIWDLITAFGYTKCTDYRDKIYALLSLEKDLGSVKRIPINYRIAKAELFWTVVIKRFTLEEELFFVHLMHLGDALGWDGLSKSELLAALELVRKRVPCSFDLETPFQEFCLWNRDTPGFSPTV